MSYPQHRAPIVPLWHSWYSILFNGGIVGVLIGFTLIDEVAERNDTLRIILGGAAIVIGLLAASIATFAWCRDRRDE